VIRVIVEENPDIRIHRAKFSANTKAEIKKAMNNLVKPNLSEAEVRAPMMRLTLGCGTSKGDRPSSRSFVYQSTVANPAECVRER
jgi:hypothetical protein